MTETEIKKQILDYLKTRGIEAWRNNTGTRGRVQFGKKDSPDVIGYLPNGLFLGIEIKRPGSRPTVGQFEFLLRLNNSGGCGVWGTSLEEIIPIIDEYMEKKVINRKIK